MISSKFSFSSQGSSDRQPIAHQLKDVVAVQKHLAQLPEQPQRHQAGEQEHHVKEHVMMLDMADLVADNRFHFFGAQVAQQLIGQHDVARPGQDARDHGVGRGVARVPQQDGRDSET